MTRLIRIAFGASLIAALGVACGESTAPRTPAQLAFLTTPAGVSAGAPISPHIQVAIQDDKGRTVTSATNQVTIAFGSNPANGTLSGTVTATASGGVATFSNLSIDKSGSGYTLTTSAQGLAGATSAPFSVSAGAPSRLAFTAQPADAVAGAAISPGVKVTVFDALDNVVTAFASSISLALSSSNSATLTGPSTLPTTNGVAEFTGLKIAKAGTGYTLVASATGLTGATSAAFAVVAGAATKVGFLTQPSAQVDAGTKIAPAIQVALQDQYGNNTSSGSAIVTLSLASNPGSATLTGTLSTAAVNGVATFDNVIVDRAGDGYRFSASGLTSSTTSSQFNVRLLFASVSAGGNYFESHTCALTIAGAAYCWGANGLGQLGVLGTGGVQLRPRLVVGGLTFTSISVGGYHTCAVSTDSDVYCWGYNGEQQLGDGSTSQRSIPGKVAGTTKFSAVAAGDSHTCALGTTGIVYCWGANPDGRLGNGIVGGNVGTPAPVSGGLTYQAIAADSAHTCALSSGAAYCWGANNRGQLGDASTTQRSSPTPVNGGFTWSTIAPGARHTCAVNSGTQLVYCWGDNSRWQTADAAPNDRTTPRTTPQPLGLASPLTQVSQLSAGAEFNCAVGTLNSQSPPVVWCWGANDKSQIGIDSYYDVVSPSTVYGSTPNISRIDAGRVHACEVLPSALIACWGDNSSGQLGDGTTILRTTPKLIAP